MEEPIDVEYRLIFASLPGCFLLLHPDTHFTVADANDAFLHATGAVRREVVGRSVFDVLPDRSENVRSSAGRLRVSLERVLASGRADAMGDNSPVLSPDGEVRYIIHRVGEPAAARSAQPPLQGQSPLLDGDQTLCATDILESITDGFFALDREWRFTYVNREGGRILGRGPGELIGQLIWNEYPGLIGSDFERAYRRAMDVQRATSSVVAFYPDHDRWYESHVYPATDGVTVYFRNVTKRERAEAERARLLAASEQQRRMYEAALSNTPDLVYVFDVNHRFAYANEALLRMWGKTREQAVGRNCLELGYPDWHAAMHDREIEEVIDTGEPIRGEVPFSGTQGRRMYEYIFVPVFGPEGNVAAVAGTTRDVTDRQRAEQAIREQAERLRAADRAKDEFLATLAHELRNPLAPLRNALHLMRAAENAPPAAPAPGVLEMMERQVNNLVRLVDDLLDMSRISRGTVALRSERVELAAIVRNAIDTSRPLIDAAGHRLHVALPEEPLWLEGDPVRLAQILANLLNNAAKYTEARGGIFLSAERDGAAVAVSVRDTGIGIGPDALPRLFEMFNRGAEAGGRGDSGLGIGLALSYKLAELHGGTLEAHSAGVGEGSEFVLRLPVTAGRDAGPDATPHATQAPARGGQGAVSQQRILVVDDNRDAAESLAMILEGLGAEVRVARSGSEALRELTHYEAAVVLLDIGMPGLDGYEVARRIRSRYPARGMTLIALTGWGQKEDRRRASEAGFDYHLVKPAQISDLQRLLGPAPGSARSP